MDTEEKNYYITKNEREYGKYYPLLKWVEPEQCAAAAEKRGELIRQCGDSIHADYKGSKLFTHKLSAGCRHCGGGTWSCLFINGFCRAGCFFCPSSQNTMGQPVTNSILFPNPSGYIDYIEKFNIQGVSLSGGEPLASLERSLMFLREIKSHFRDKIYLWLYTNGRLVSREKLILLKEAGLNEIRFNIAADNYSLIGVKTAVEIMDKVTVEIPAVPEDKQRLMELLPVLKKTGISFLNLHQLRLTPFNLKKMLPRPYTYLHGPKVTVMESELTALAVMQDALARGIDLPVNYCSFVYKNRFQTVGNRKRVAPLIMTSREEVNETGLIRSLFIKPPPDKWAKLEKFGVLDKNLGRLYIHSSQAGHSSVSAYSKFISYFGVSVRPALTYRYPFKEINLRHHSPVYIEKNPVMRERRIPSSFPQSIPDDLKRFECIPHGLAEYY